MSVNALPCTSENIFSMELWVAKVTLSFSDSSVNFSPWLTKSNTLNILLESHLPNFRSRPEKTAFSLTFPFESAKIYSRHCDAGVKIIGDFGTIDVVISLFKWCPQSVCNKRNVRKTFETVSARTLRIEKLRRRHEVWLLCFVHVKWNK